MGHHCRRHHNSDRGGSGPNLQAIHNYVLAATPGKVLVINASGSIIGSVPINASGVSAASYGGML
ncbi:MAG: hypothetical protein RXQ96_05590, partial [Thermocladium sp.]